jgi:hypothetical protein
MINELEVKYLVLKLSDICTYLDTEQIETLERLAQTVTERKTFSTGRNPTDYAIVGKDWFGGGLYLHVREEVLKELNK